MIFKNEIIKQHQKVQKKRSDLHAHQPFQGSESRDTTYAPGTAQMRAEHAQMNRIQTEGGNSPQPQIRVRQDHKKLKPSQVLAKYEDRLLSDQSGMRETNDTLLNAQYSSKTGYTTNAKQLSVHENTRSKTYNHHNLGVPPHSQQKASQRKLPDISQSHSQSSQRQQKRSSYQAQNTNSLDGRRDDEKNMFAKIAKQ